jgi:hypothetical protein
MAFFTGTYDPRALELMTQVLETAAAQARSHELVFVEDLAVEDRDGWSVMGRAVWSAVAGGDRDLERLGRKAIDELNVHRARKRGEVVASSIGTEHIRPLLIRLRFSGTAEETSCRSRVGPPASKRKPFSAR